MNKIAVFFQSASAYIKSYLFSLFFKKAFIFSILKLQSKIHIKAENYLTHYEDEFGNSFLSSIKLKVMSGSLLVRSLVGSGENTSRKRAELVACAEAIERLSHYIDLNAFPRLGKTSSGCAFHSSERQAVFNGVCELLERDAILSRWYGGGKLPFIDPPAKFVTSSLINFELKFGGKLRTHYFPDDRYQFHSVTLTYIGKVSESSKQNFFLTGLGGSCSLQKAFKQAETELIRFIRYFRDIESGLDVNSELKENRVASSSGRLYLYQLKDWQEKYLKRLCKVEFQEADYKSSHDELKWLRFILKENMGFSYERIFTPFPFSLIGSSVRCSNPKLQVLDYDDEPRINRGRLGEVFGDEYIVCKDLHFIP